MNLRPTKTFKLSIETPIDTPKNKLTVDGIEIHIHIRELDNRVRIVLSTPSWAINQNKNYWYASVEDLVDHEWKHRRCHDVIDHSWENVWNIAQKLYDDLVAK